MSVVTALKFVERVEREDSLRHQLYISKPEDIYTLTQFARAKGFIISTEDLVEALEQYQEQYVKGSVQPLKAYLNGYKRLPSGEENAVTEVEE
jgi:hypothetical protein